MHLEDYGSSEKIKNLTCKIFFVFALYCLRQNPYVFFSTVVFSLLPKAIQRMGIHSDSPSTYLFQAITQKKKWLQSEITKELEAIYIKDDAEEIQSDFHFNLAREIQLYFNLAQQYFDYDRNDGAYSYLQKIVNKLNYSQNMYLDEKNHFWAQLIDCLYKQCKTIEQKKALFAENKNDKILLNLPQLSKFDSIEIFKVLMKHSLYEQAVMRIPTSFKGQAQARIMLIQKAAVISEENIVQFVKEQLESLFKHVEDSNLNLGDQACIEAIRVLKEKDCDLEYAESLLQPNQDKIINYEPRMTTAGAIKEGQALLKAKQDENKIVQEIKNPLNDQSLLIIGRMYRALSKGVDNLIDANLEKAQIYTQVEKWIFEAKNQNFCKEEHVKKLQMFSLAKIIASSGEVDKDLIDALDFKNISDLSDIERFLPSLIQTLIKNQQLNKAESCFNIFFKSYCPTSLFKSPVYIFKSGIELARVYYNQKDFMSFSKQVSQLHSLQRHYFGELMLSLGERINRVEMLVCLQTFLESLS